MLPNCNPSRAVPLLPLAMKVGLMLPSTVNAILEFSGMMKRPVPPKRLPCAAVFRYPALPSKIGVARKADREAAACLIRDSQIAFKQHGIQKCAGHWIRGVPDVDNSAVHEPIGAVESGFSALEDIIELNRALAQRSAALETHLGDVLEAGEQSGLKRPDAIYQAN